MKVLNHTPHDIALNDGTVYQGIPKGEPIPRVGNVYGKDDEGYKKLQCS